jgi:hypothetical protein
MIHSNVGPNGRSGVQNVLGEVSRARCELKHKRTFFFFSENKEIGRRNNCVKFEFITVVDSEDYWIIVFWDMPLRNLVDCCQRFGGTCY